MSRQILAGGLRRFIAPTLTIEASRDSSEITLSLPETEPQHSDKERAQNAQLLDLLECAVVVAWI
jgi:hypothetical protein